MDEDKKAKAPKKEPELDAMASQNDIYVAECDLVYKGEWHKRGSYISVPKGTKVEHSKLKKTDKVEPLAIVKVYDIGNDISGASTVGQVFKGIIV